MQCIITAVYDELRADSGTINSVIPIYIVSPAALLIVTATLTAMIIAVNIILTLWLRKSVSVPMDILKRNTDAIEAGDLDYTEYYIGNDEFSELYLKLMSMRSELKASENQRKRYENARSELMRGISHDLRSPLTTIKGYAEGIRDGVADSEEKRTRYCNAIITRANDNPLHEAEK